MKLEPQSSVRGDKPRRRLRFHHRFHVMVAVGLMTAAAGMAAVGQAELASMNEQGLAAHRTRCLNEASRHYAQLLARDPPAEPTPEQFALIMKFAPRLHNVTGEFFPLKDIVAVVHPDRPMIAYRLLWEDDAGFPSDNDPCDHEIVWIEYDPADETVTRVHTYFHGKILSPEGAAEEANAHGGRAWIGVEWGFHGSIPAGGLEAARPTLHEHWQRAHRGREGPPDPLARGWPTRFAGSFDAFIEFSVSTDPRQLLQKRRLVWVSRWPMAVLNRYALRYNVAVKADWPPGSDQP